MNSPFPIYKLPGNYMAFCNMQRNTKAHLVKISKQFDLNNQQKKILETDHLYVKKKKKRVLQNLQCKIERQKLLLPCQNTLLQQFMNKNQLSPHQKCIVCQLSPHKEIVIEQSPTPMKRNSQQLISLLEIDPLESPYKNVKKFRSSSRNYLIKNSKEITEDSPQNLLNNNIDSQKSQKHCNTLHQSKNGSYDYLEFLLNQKLNSLPSKFINRPKIQSMIFNEIDRTQFNIFLKAKRATSQFLMTKI